MKKKLLIAALAAFAITAFAQTSVKPTVAGWTSVGRSIATNGQIELKNQVYTQSDVEKADLFYGVLHFDLPTAPEGKVLAKATLRLVTERVKNNRNTGVYLTTAEITASASFADLQSALETAVAATPLTQFEMVGNSNSVQYDNQSNEQYQDLANWTNTVDLPVGSFKYASTLNLVLFSTEVRNSSNDSNRFFGTAGKSSNATKDIIINADNEDLVPLLTLEYEDANIGDADVVSPTISGWTSAGRSIVTGGQIELKNQTYTKNDAEQTDLFYGLLHFDMPEVPAGMKMAAATLRLVTERVKNDRATDIYLLDTEIAASSTFADLQSAIETAVDATPLAQFEMVGNSNSVQYDNQSNEQYQDLANWTNYITLPVDNFNEAATLNLVVYSPKNRTSQNDSNRFFSTAGKSSNASKDIIVNADNEDLVPQLTIVYEANDETVDVVTIKAQPALSNVYYNMAGQRVGTPTRPATTGDASTVGLKKGLYIVGGKKIAVQ